MATALFTSPLSAILISLAFGYLLGSIPFGVVITRLAGVGDVRQIGSGNIGATNVLRTGRKGLAALTLLADALKGAVAVLIAGRYGQDLALVAGLGAFLGHLFPVWLGFRGGKGVATYIGILIAVAVQGALIFALVWLSVAAITRYSSLAAIIAAIIAPAALWAMGAVAPAVFFGIMTLFIIVKHHANILRLLSGTESRIGSKG